MWWAGNSKDWILRKWSSELVIFEKTVLVNNTYYPSVRQCHKCGSLDHTQQSCRSRKRCLRCEKCEDSSDGSCDMLKCILCGENNHIAGKNDKCPKWHEEIETYKSMTKKNTSKREVIQSYKCQSRFSILWNNENFPPLPEGRKRSNSNANTMIHISV